MCWTIPHRTGALCFSFLQKKAFLESPDRWLSPQLYFRSFGIPTHRFGGSKCARLSAPFQGPIVSVSCK